MARSEQIHWCEGLFMQPHHLQLMQRGIYERLRIDRSVRCPFPYGLLEYRISDDELENMRISFDSLKIVMPSGIEVDVPGNTDLSSLDIKEAFASSTGDLTVSIGVPLRQTAGGNSIEIGGDRRTKRTYRVVENKYNDENTGKNEQSILVRHINARLLLDDDDTSDMEVLPILKIIRSSGDEIGLPRRNPDYIPPCMVLAGSTVLYEMIRDITNQVMASRKELVLQINRGGFSIENMRGVQFEQMLRLGTLNHFSSNLGAMIQIPKSTTPFEVYIVLSQLLGQLAALRPDNDQYEVCEYNHDNPSVAFRDITGRIRSLLKGSVQASFLKIPFTFDSQEGLFAAELTDEAVSLPNEYFLGIKTRTDHAELAKLVLDRNQFKFMPRSLAKQKIFGVQLTHEPFPPVELPAQVGLHYFRLNYGQSTRVWERIKTEKMLSIVWPGIESSDFDITLYMTVPGTGR